MSVINQMLKDLDERTPEQVNNSNNVPLAIHKKTSKKMVAMIVLFLLVFNAIGLYIWSLSQENQALQQSLLQTNQAATIQPKREKGEVKTLAQPKKILPEKREPIQVASKPRSMPPELVQAKVIKSNPLESAFVKEDLIKESLVKDDVAKESTIKTEVRTESPEKPKSSMSVTRRQLTEPELIEQKLVKAEKEIDANNLQKAEELFEDILLIDPNQQQARKKLAALWFGRKSFNDAINLLSQGIILAPENSEFRSMQAHVYLQQSNLIQAYNTLKPLENLPQQEYQLLIVNISQQLENYTAAIKAYNILLKLQPKNSRWHLGLAIIYDQNSQFVLAVNEYELALEQRQLSQDSSRFAKQRIQALGVK